MLFSFVISVVVLVAVSTTNASSMGEVSDFPSFSDSVEILRIIIMTKKIGLKK